MHGRVLFRSSVVGAVSLLALATAGATVARAAPYAYTTSIDGQVSQFDIATGGLVALTPASVAGGSGPPPSALNGGVIPNRPAVSPDGRSFYAANSTDNQVRQYDVGADGTLTPKSAAAVAAGSQPIAVAVSPDGASVYVANFADNTISEYAVGPGGTLTPRATVPSGPNPVEVAVTPDGRHVYALNRADSTISQYDVGAGGSLVPKPAVAATGADPGGLAVSPDGRSVYVAAGSTIWQYDISGDGSLAPKSPAQLAGSLFISGDVAVSPDGSDLYAADAYAASPATPGVAHFTLGAGGGATYAGRTSAEQMRQLAIAPDGRSLYGADIGGPARLVQFDRASGGALTGKTPMTVTPASAPLGIVVSPSSDVSLSGTADRTQLTAGRVLTYSFTASNSGSPATGVTVSDTLPRNVTFQSASASQGSCTGVGTITCSLGSLASGASATVTIAVRALQAGTLTNAASVEALQPDPSPGNDTASVDASVAAMPQATTSDASALTPSGATLNGVVMPNGRPTTYRFEYGTGGVLDRQAPAVPGDAGDGVDAVAVAETLNGLQPGTRYDFRLVATDADGATAVGATRSFTTPQRPVPAVDLGLTAAAMPGRLTAGRVVTFAFTVVNRSATDAATGVRVLAPLPGDVRVAAGRLPTGCTAATGGTAVTCAVGALAPGAGATVRVPLVAQRAGRLRVTGVASGDQVDPTPADDIASAAVTVVARPLVSIARGPRLAGRTVSVVLACASRSARRCTGTATLTAAGRKVRARVYTLAAGSRSTLRFALPRPLLSRLASHHRVAVKLTVRPKGGGNVRGASAVLRR